MDVERQHAVLVGGARSDELVVLLSITLRSVIAVVGAALLGIAGHGVETNRHDGSVQRLRFVSVESAYYREIGNHLALVGDAEELSRYVQERLVAIGQQQGK